MCRVQFHGLVLIVDLLLQRFHFIQGISTNKFPKKLIIVPSVKGVVPFVYECGLRFELLSRIVYGLALID